MCIRLFNAGLQETFSAKFKTKQLAERFRELFTKCVDEAKASAAADVTTTTPSDDVTQATGYTANAQVGTQMCRTSICTYLVHVQFIDMH